MSACPRLTGAGNGRPAGYTPMPPDAPRPPVSPAEHVAWARSIARTVARAHRFVKGGQEEQELEATALLSVCTHAARFDPAKAFRAGARPKMKAAAHGYRHDGPQPSGELVLGSPLVVAGADVGRWVLSQCRRLTKDRRAVYRLRAAELAARAARAFALAFDPAGAFRGFSAAGVRADCRREAIRLRNGGTFHRSRNPYAAPSVRGLPAGHALDDALGGRASMALTAADGGRHRDLGRAALKFVPAPDVRRPALDEDEGDEWNPCVTTLE